MKKNAILSIAFLVIFAIYFGENVLTEMSEKEAMKISLNNYLEA